MPSASLPADPSLVATIPTGSLPVQVAIDATDPRGRIYVTNSGSETVTVLQARATDASRVDVVASIGIGSQPSGVAVNPANGRVYVTTAGDCRLSVIDGRAEAPFLVSSVDLGATPAGVAVDGETGRVFVAEPAANQVAVLEPSGDGLRAVATLVTGVGPTGLQVVPATGLVVVANGGGSSGTDTGAGSVAVIDGRADPPRIVGTAIPSSVPAGIAADPVSGLLFVSENGEDRIMSIRLGVDGTPALVARVAADPNIDPARSRNPTGIAVLPERRELFVNLYGADHANLFAIGEGGVLTFLRSISGVAHTVGAALDPVTGRVYSVEREWNQVRVLDLEVPSPLALPFVLPGPFDISLAPRDVARSAGLTLLVMLLVGAPSHLFNSTLDANQAEIRRRLPFSRRRGRLAVAARWLSRRPLGAVLYLAAAAVLYSFLDPQFPGNNGALVLAATGVGIGLSTALAVLPGDRYVQVRFARHGRFRVAGWTLGIAAACVLLARLTSMEPGYVYGIIGVVVFNAPLDRVDRGRMAWRGGLLLLAVALLSWFARVPFQPAPGESLAGVGLVVNKVLVAIFVTAVEGLVFGMVPLRFMHGAPLRAWSTARWLAIWAAGLLLFAHVILYPVSTYEPNPSAVGIWTVVTVVASYGAVALAFWAYFRFRPDRVLSARAPG